MRCFRKILGFTYKDYVTIEGVRNRIKQAARSHEDLATVKKRKLKKLKWYCNDSRASGLTKTVLQATVQREAGRRKDRKTTSENGQTKHCVILSV